MNDYRKFYLRTKKSIEEINQYLYTILSSKIRKYAHSESSLQNIEVYKDKISSDFIFILPTVMVWSFYALKYQNYSLESADYNKIEYMM